jgi:glycosyltransferase involved in cell wall biosynthesis
MRILHVIPSLAARDGGPPTAVIQMCRELLRRNEDTEIYTTNADGSGCLDVRLRRPTEVEGVTVTYFPINGSHYYKCSSALALALKTNVSKFDAVDINSLYQFPSTAAAHYCRKQGVPYLVRPHGTLDPYLYRRHSLRKRLYELLIERRNLAAAAAVHFTTAEEMRLAKLSGLCFHGTVAPLGVEFEREPAVPWNAADTIWPQLRGKKLLLFLSRVNFKKGLDILARAFGEIHRTRQDTHLVIAGPDTDGYATKVRGWLAEEGALEAATFTGMVLGERKGALLKRADLFVLPSYTENFGIAVVEAMVAGLPLVISNRVNIWREIVAADAGLVVKPDAQEVARAVMTLFENPSFAKDMGVRGRCLAHEKFSWQAAGDRLVRLYQEVVAARSLAPTSRIPRAAVG